MLLALLRREHLVAFRLDQVAFTIERPLISLLSGVGGFPDVYCIRRRDALQIGFAKFFRTCHKGPDG